MKIILGITRSDRANGYSSFDDGYRPGAEQQAVTLTLPDGFDGLSIEQWAKAMFIASNAPGASPDEDGAVTALRDALERARRAGCQIRSLSVGDTVTVNGDTVACAKTGWERVEDAGTWTFFGHWHNDRLHVEDALDGSVDDVRADTGRHEQGLWAAAASGPSKAVAEQIAVAEYEGGD